MRHRDLMWEEMNYNFKWTKQLKLGRRGNACHEVLTKQRTMVATENGDPEPGTGSSYLNEGLMRLRAGPYFIYSR